MTMTVKELQEMHTAQPTPETPAHKLMAALDTAIASREADKARYYTHIGGSILSEECEARAAYTYRWALPPEQHEPRILRIFQLGKEMEQSILHWLIEARGVRLSEDTLSDTQEVVNGLWGHLKCHLDGIAEMDNVRYVLELKTHNDSQYKLLTAKGVQVSHPKHYQQCQTYMHFSGIHKCLYIAYNKNDSRMHVEEIVYDKEMGQEMETRAMRLLEGGPYTRTEERWQCNKFGGCPFKDICRGGRTELMARNCRTCAYAAPLKRGGQWACTKTNEILSVEDQERGCNEHQLTNI